MICPSLSNAQSTAKPAGTDIVVCVPHEVEPASYLTMTVSSAIAPGAAKFTATGYAGSTACSGAGVLTSINIIYNGLVVATAATSPVTYSLSNLSPGTYTLNAETVTSNNGTMSSASQTLTVTPVQPTISLTSPANGASYIAPVSIPLTVSATGGTYTITNVKYYDGSTLLGTVTGTTSPWTYTATGLLTGSHAIHAVVTTNGGTTATSGTNTITISAPAPSIAWSTPANNSNFPSNGSIPLSVTATGNTYPITNVTYYNGSTVLESINGSSGSFPWSVTGLPVGTYSLTAKVTNSSGLTATTSPLTVNVLTIPTISVAGPSDGTALAASSGFTLSPTVTAGAYTINSVSYQTSSGITLCTATSSPWSCSYSTGFASAGSYSITATVNTTTSGVSETSNPITVTVGAATGSPVSSATPLPVNVTPPSLTNSPAATLPGDIGVSPAGAATYSIPLAIPPGLHGMSPSLALNYNSENMVSNFNGQSMNGMLGLGWTLGGLSAIHRCNKTLAQDGSTSRVSFTNTDRLCLDGQRLILTSIPGASSGNPDTDYWTIGATYSTELTNFSVITAIKNSAGNIAFEVQTKAGQILYYGANGDGSSFIVAQGQSSSVAIAWTLGQAQDLFGNYFTVSYTNNVTSGEYLPSQINYGGNLTINQAPTMSVVFNYDTTRPDGMIRYVAGSHNNMVSRLDNIQAYTGVYGSGTPVKVREYDITYGVSPSSGRSMIQSVQMQALNPQSKTMVAFPATSFTWGTQVSSTLKQVGGTFSGPVPPAPYPLNLSVGNPNPQLNFVNFDKIIWADFNGDGLLDAMVIDTSQTPNQYYIYLAQPGGGFAAPINWSIPSQFVATIAARKTAESFGEGELPLYQPASVVGDFNGDGSSDLFLFGGIVCLSQMSTNLSVPFNCMDINASATLPGSTIPVLTGWYPADYLVMDTTGSGHSDLIMRNWSAYVPAGTVPTDPGIRCVSNMSTGSFTGFNCGTYGNVNLAINGVQDPKVKVSATGTYVTNLIGDYNGDGLQDLYRMEYSGEYPPYDGFMEVCLAGTTGFNCQNWGTIPTGAAITPASTMVYSPNVSGSTPVNDFNGDGLSDIYFGGAYTALANYDPVICYSTGVSFDCHNVTAADPADAQLNFVGAVDSDGSFKELAFEYNASYSTGTWRICTLQYSNSLNTTTLNCQNVTSSTGTNLAVTSLPSIAPGYNIFPIGLFGGFLNDGSINLLTYNPTIDDTTDYNYNTANNGAYYYNPNSAGAAYTLSTFSQGSTVAADKLTSVTNGIGRISNVTYTNAGQTSVYTQYSPANMPPYPSKNVINPGFLVSALQNSNGQNGYLETTYSYMGELTDALGRGSKGFAQITSTNLQPEPTTDTASSFYGLQTTTNYSQVWPYYGLVKSAVKSTYTGSGTAGQAIINTTNQYGLLTTLTDAYYSANASLIPGQEITSCIICFPYVSSSTTTSTDINGSDLGTVITTKGMPDNGGDDVTVTETSKLAADSTAFTTVINNTWYPYSGSCVTNTNNSYIIGKLCSSTVTKTNETAPYLGGESGASVTRASNYTYDLKGFNTSSILESGIASLQVTNTYVPDYVANSTGVGNVSRKTQTWTDPASGNPFSRTSSMTYTSDGRFLASVTNAMGMTESYVTDSATGARTQLTDANNLITNWTVDGLGRVLSETLPDTNVTNWAYNKCASDCPPYATMVTIKTHYNNTTAQSSGVPELSYANPLGQVIRTMTYGYSGIPIVTDRVYDTLARQYADYQPTYAPGATNGASATYPSGNLASARTGIDQLNRTTALKTLNENGSPVYTTTTYAGATSTITNGDNEVRVETRDVLRQLINVVDNSTGLTSANPTPATTTGFAYDPFGNLTQTTDPAGNLIVVKYDAMGHKTQLNDPDLGTINYYVDPVGRTWKQISPNEAAGPGTTFQYDWLDRMISRLEPDLNSYFIYDVSGATGAALSGNTVCQPTHSCGRLVESYTLPPSGSNVGVGNGTNKESDTTNNYDSLGRLANSTVALDANHSFYSETDFDSWDRPISQISQYTQMNPANTPVQKIYDLRYNSYGYLQVIQRSGLTLWTALTQDAANRVVTAQLASAGGQSDGLIATRCYSAYSGRLTSATVAPNGNTVTCGAALPAVYTLNESYSSYDNIGNILNRTEAWNVGITGTVATNSYTETFTYDGLNRIANSTNQGQTEQVYTYSADGSVTNKTGVGAYAYTGGTSGGAHAVKSIVTPSNGTMNFTYDADGNLLTGNNRTNTWTSFDMPLSLTYLGAGSQFPTTSSVFAYGPNHERRKQSQGSTDVIYYGGSQEVMTDTSNNVISVKTYWPHGLGVEIDRPSQVASELDWTHTDNLGSIIGITDIDGNLKEALQFDAWGSRRNLSGTPASIASEATAAVTENTDDKGYTGQEMIDSLELVHLNGRVYDPLISKFLSADQLIGQPTNGQNFNRYSYVLNNPMNATDPTGFVTDSQSGCMTCDWTIVSGSMPGVGTGSSMSSFMKDLDSLSSEEQQKVVDQIKAKAAANGSAPTGQASGLEQKQISTLENAANSTPSVFQQLKDGYTGDTRSVMYPQTPLETAGRYAGYVGDFVTSLLPGSSLPEVGAQAGKGNYGVAAIMLGTEFLGPIGGEARAALGFEKAAIVGGGATLDRLTLGEMQRIQNAADKSGVDISVVGSRVNPEKALRAGSDYDYVINANNKVRSDLKGSLPGAKNIKEGQSSNLDIFNVPLDKSLPHVTFKPQ